MKKQVVGSLILVMVGMLFIACPNPVVDPVSYQLSVATTGSGSVTLNPDKTEYVDGESVELTANAAAGYVFDHWEGDLTGAANPATVTMDTDKSVTAVFVEGTYSLSVSVTGSGTVAADPDEAEYDVNEEITLTATPESGYGFSHWEGDLSGIENPIAFNIDSNMSVTAVFAETATSHLLTINSATGGSVTIDPEQNYYNNGEEVELTAVPDFGYKFIEWTGDLTGSTNPATVTMDSDKTITPVFLEIFALDIAVTGSGSVTPNPDKTEYVDGESVELTANAAAGFIFDHWEGDLTGTTNPDTIIMDSSKSITAVFLELFNISVSTTGSGSVTLNPDKTEYADGESVEFTATPAAGYIFDHWEGDLSGTANPVSLTMDSDKTVTAVFINNWTIMVYLDADNNLEGAGIEDFNEMESVNLDGLGINLIVLFDRIDGEDSSNGDWTNTRLYEIEYDSSGLNTTIISQRLASSELGLTATGNEELNMGNPTTASNFIDFCKSEYPANNYAFIFWNHGSGWRSKATGSKSSSLPEGPLSRIIGFDLEPKEGGAVPGGYKAVCSDDTSSDILYTQEIGSSISGKGIDVVGFDACFEGMIEVAYEIRNSADYMLASEQTEPGDGWEYHFWLNNFKATGMTQVDLVNSIVDAYETRYSATSFTTLSGLDLSEINNLFTALNTFSTTLYNACTTDLIRDEVLTILWMDAEYYWTTPGDNNIDIWDMADEILSQTNYADTAASGLKTAVEAAVIKEWHNSSGNPDSHGIAIHLIQVDASGNPVSISTAYGADYTGAYPLQFVSNSSNTWVPDFTVLDGLLYRLWFEVLP